MRSLRKDQRPRLGDQLATLEPGDEFKLLRPERRKPRQGTQWALLAGGCLRVVEWHDGPLQTRALHYQR